MRNIIKNIVNGIGGLIIIHRAHRMGLLLSFLSVFSLSVWSQEHGVAQDTLAFRQYLSDNFGTRADIVAIFQLYHRLGAKVTREEKDKVYTEAPYIGGDPVEFFFGIDSYVGILKEPDITNWVPEVPQGRRDNYFFPDSLRSRLRKEIQTLDFFGPDKRRDDKEALIQALAAFDSVTTNKPLFFADIYRKFKGDYRKYVNHLYKKSILLSNPRMMKFTLRPTTKKLQTDPGVQFVIGLALYESWIRDVREGRVKDNQ